MNRALLATALILGCAASQTALSLERTSNARDVNQITPEITINAQNALVTAAISKVNHDISAILRCNNKNMFYKPHDSLADGDGCVGATISTSTSTHSVNLPNVNFDSYPGHSKNKKGYTGTSTRVIDLSGIAASGASAIAVTATRSSFSGACQQGDVTMNIANVNANVAATEFYCHYDNSPNRNTRFIWSYNGSTRQLTVQARMGQVKAIMTNAKLIGVKAAYQVTKTTLKVGSGS